MRGAVDTGHEGGGTMGNGKRGGGLTLLGGDGEAEEGELGAGPCELLQAGERGGAGWLLAR